MSYIFFSKTYFLAIYGIKESNLLKRICQNHQFRSAGVLKPVALKYPKKPQFYPKKPEFFPEKLPLKNIVPDPPTLRVSQAPLETPDFGSMRGHRRRLQNIFLLAPFNEYQFMCHPQTSREIIYGHIRYKCLIGGWMVFIYYLQNILYM